MRNTKTPQAASTQVDPRHLVLFEIELREKKYCDIDMLKDVGLADSRRTVYPGHVVPGE